MFIKMILKSVLSCTNSKWFNRPPSKKEKQKQEYGRTGFLYTTWTEQLWKYISGEPVWTSICSKPNRNQCRKKELETM